MNHISTQIGGAADVVVVGAGVGGLRVAVELQRQAHRGTAMSVAVLEARSRVGGRVHCVPVAGGHLDLGATWFWANEPRINELIASSGLRSFAQHIDGDMMFENNGAHRLDGNQLGQPSGRLVGGMQAVATALFNQLPDGVVAFEQVVRSIRRVGDGLVVATADGSFTAQHVVLALPPALAVASIDFEPELPAELQALAASTPVWMGATTKVVVAYERPFWRDHGLAGSAFSYDGPMREIHDMSGPNGDPAALFGFCPGTPSVAPPTPERVLSQLGALFGPQARSPLAVHIMDWKAEPFTSPPGVEALTRFDTFGHRLYQRPTFGGRLHWASTETSTDAPGHIEGALAAADRAAAAIATALG
jgi:monoamine oxidase